MTKKYLTVILNKVKNLGFIAVPNFLGGFKKGLVKKFIMERWPSWLKAHAC